MHYNRIQKVLPLTKNVQKDHAETAVTDHVPKKVIRNISLLSSINYYSYTAVLCTQLSLWRERGFCILNREFLARRVQLMYNLRKLKKKL